MPESNNSSDGVVEVNNRLDLLIAPRRSLRAKSAGIQPLSTMTMSSAMSAVGRMQGAEIVREISPRRKLRTMSSADEATSVFKVRADVDAAVQLFRTAPPSLAVEMDAVLAYGQTSPLLEAILARQLGWVDNSQTQQVRVKVVGTKGEPVAAARVVLEAIGFPQQGQTDENGEVALTIVPTGAGAAVRSLFIAPTKDYWNRYLVSPALSLGVLNVVKLQTIGEAVAGFPSNFAFGWGQKYMGLDQLPDEYTGKGVKIAIIDSGADNTHPVLKHIIDGIDLTNGNDSRTWATDVVGHGSHCAGIIAGRNDSTAAIRGFAPEAEIHVFKVFPGGQFSSLLDALNFCVELGVDLVNMSLGSADASEAVEQALDDAVQNGVACIVAAGNSGGPVQYPARSPNVMAVAALGMMGEFPTDSWEASTIREHTPEGLFSPSFTCFGPEVAVAAPGVGIISTVPGGFDPQSGTSMAAPHVTGLAALLVAHHPAFKGALRERNAARVAGLFRLIRSLCSPVPLGPQKTGSGVPKLVGLLDAFGADRRQPSNGAAALAPQGVFGNLMSSFAPVMGGAVGSGMPPQVMGAVGPMSAMGSPLVLGAYAPQEAMPFVHLAAYPAVTQYGLAWSDPRVRWS